MNNVLIGGTIATDTIETPFGKVDRVLGGSASYAAYSASFYVLPSIISVVGEDFSEEHWKLLQERKINLEGVKKEGKTFHWEGSYEFDMNEAKTLKTELNSLETFKPVVPDQYKKAEYLFLANIDPVVQLSILNQLESPKLVITDTMNFWIESNKQSVLDVIKKTNILLLNDAEARQLFETTSLVKAAKQALTLGPSAVIIKKGEHGALLFTEKSNFNAPGYPLEEIKDPTGCGDAFGGALLGYLAKTNDHSEENMRKAIIQASAIASFNAEDFSLNKLKTITQEDIDTRYNEFVELRKF
ncbi:MAG: PfkB family carbohydrate kinase [Nanoarchaeota archaeon]|nr:PfkB family carbohydrate kinase [Nanoarchaeota archaeon]